MTKYLTLFLTLFFASYVHSGERIAGTMESVDLIIEDMYNDNGHNFGERFYAINRNDFPIRLSIHLTEAKNAENSFVAYTLIINPLEKVKLGKVRQKDLTAESSWNYEWEVQRD